MPTYTVEQAATRNAEQGLRLTDSGGDQAGPRLVFASHPGWVHVPGAGKMDHAGPDQPGIYTSGQFQCVAVIVAKPGLKGGWDAWLAHVGHPKHSLLIGATGLVHQVDGTAYVLIGARASALGSMNEIRATFAHRSPAGIWIYAANSNGSPDFGMSSQGWFGETVQWIVGEPSNAPQQGNFLGSHRPT